jgi:membrane-associated phospholipid phosphatase
MTRESERVAAPRGAPFLAWPGWRHLAYATGLSLANLAWFEIVFITCDAITRGRTLRLSIHTPLDLKIPFVPWMTVVYLSIDLLLLAGPFILRTRREFRAAIAMLAVAIAVGGVCFLLIPADLAYAPVLENEVGIWTGAFHLADAVNLTYNLVPSLHVALTVACIAAFTTQAGPRGKALMWLWGAAIAISTVLTHQHHLLDVVSGWLLGELCFRWVYRPLTRS